MANDVLANLAVRISAQTADFGKALANTQNQLKSFLSGVKQVGAALGVSFGATAIFNGLQAAVGIMSDFEATMSEVKAITGATGREFDALEKDALKLGAATKFTASQVGQLQVAYGRLGFNTKEILDATEATLDLAAATGEDLAKSADVAGSTVRGFGLQARETQRIVDVMAASFNKTALGLDNFTESMKYVAPIAAAANVSVEETTALLGVLADAGIRGSSAGTALRKIFGDLSKDGRPVAQRLDELGKKGITLKDSFDEVGRTAQTALLVLTKNRDKADELTAAFQNVEGEAAKMARTMSDNLAGDVTKLTSAWEGLILSLSKTDALRRATQNLTSFLNVLSGTPDEDQGLRHLIRSIKEGSTSAKEQFIKDLQEVRRESGKPIDLAIINELAEKYKLTSLQANELYVSLRQVNEALSFEEKAIKQFNEFVSRNGYEDLSLAADDYKQKLYELIVAEQIRKQGLEESNIEGVFDKAIKGADEQIAAYRRVISIINDYASGFVKNEVKVQDATQATILNLNYYQEALKKVNQAFESLALAQDASGRFTEKTLSGLRILAAEGAGLEDFIKRVNLLKESFRNLDTTIKAPDTSALKKSFETIQETAGALTFETTITSMEAVTKRFEAEMEKRANAAKKHTATIQKAFVDLGAPIGSALSGIGEALGNSIAGVGNFGQDILKVVAGFARQLGEILISTGVAMLAAKKLITNPYTAIAAGVALVAIASAASAAINKSHSNSFGSGASSVASSSSSSVNTRSATEAQDVKVSGTAVIRGQDIWVLFKNVEDSNKFLKANG
jgi:hypothetical protein